MQLYYFTSMLNIDKIKFVHLFNYYVPYNYNNNEACYNVWVG